VEAIGSHSWFFVRGLLVVGFGRMFVSLRGYVSSLEAKSEQQDSREVLLDAVTVEWEDPGNLPATH
jgi:hypothetical protein